MNGEPKRVSALNSLTKCPGLVCARTVSPGSSGKAADTGTAVGRLIQLWHEGVMFEDAARKAGGEMAQDFPLADWDAARTVALFYAQDPRNRPDVVVPGSCELEVMVRLEPDEEDPTGEPIELSGHVDQIRWAFPDHPERERLGMAVWDVKNGAAYGDEMIHDYAFQIAAYAVGCTAHYGGPVMPGGIIRTQGYVPKRGSVEPAEANVFFATPWAMSDAHAILDQVRYLIGQIRAGAILRQPGKHCRWCPSSFPACVTGDLEALLTDHSA